MTEYKKKLIEVALPLGAINDASSREKNNPFVREHPRNLHLWWARRPLAAARAVIFAQTVDDPSSCPDLFLTEKAQEKERKRLFRIIEELVKWENTTNEEVLEAARAEIWQSWRRACADNVDHPRAKELFDRDQLPAFHDPFAGGGALPLEAQRLGLEAYASDLNPVAVLINKAMIEIPPKFAGRPPVNPDVRAKQRLLAKEWRGAQGLAEDVRYYGKWMRDEAEKRIGHLYPKIEVTAEMAKERPDLERYVGQELTVIAWLWARTVKSPNPAFADVDVPLVSSFMLSTKKGKEAYIEPMIEGDRYSFQAKVGKPPDPAAAKAGTKLGRGANFRCLLSGTPITAEHIREAGRSGQIGARLIAIVAHSGRGRIYLSPDSDTGEDPRQLERPAIADVEFFPQALGFRIGNYGYSKWSDLFTPRQLIALQTFCDFVHEVRTRAKRDACAAGWPDDGSNLDVDPPDASAYGDAIAVYLGLSVSQYTRFLANFAIWNTANENIAHGFGRQAIPMTWDYPEANTLHGNLTLETAISWITAPLAAGTLGSLPSVARQGDAATSLLSSGKIVSADPPYYDNIGYADLSDFFYVWLRPMLSPIFPDLFSTVSTPKEEELVATPSRHGGKVEAEEFFLAAMSRALRQLASHTHPAFPISIYYAFKQSETTESDTASTGWETFLQALLHAGFAITGTWPIRTERSERMRGKSSNALASSIVLVCRPRAADAPATSRREFLAALKAELPTALAHLQRSNIAPVDLAQAAIGPGMAVYTRYARVLESDGSRLSVRTALALINQVLDEVLAEREGDFDADSRWALAWFEQSGFDEGDYGVAETLSKAKNTSVQGLEEAGVLTSKGGKVRLLSPGDLPEDWDPATDSRLTVWEMVHHLIRVLEAGGESAAAELAAKLGSQAESARELAYRLYTICERKKRAAEALAYNALVQSWPEIMRLAREGTRPRAETGDLFGKRGD